MSNTKCPQFGLRAQWVFHPESPGEYVLVVRGFWGRLFKPAHFATFAEVETYYCWKKAWASSAQKGFDL